MSDRDETLAAHVDTLLAAERDRSELPTLSSHDGELTVDEAYGVQAELVARKVAGGDRVVGMKLGLTSKAKQQAMHVDEPCYGTLLASGLVAAGEPVRVGELIHPRVEPEIVFRMGAALEGPGVTAADVLAATDAVGCGLEVIDSRYADYSFTLADVAADNTSAARFVLGPSWVAPATIPDLALVGCLLEADGELVATAAGAAVSGHPAEAVALLANWLGRRGRVLRAGWLVLSGGLTNAVPLAAGSHVTASFGRLGSVSVRGV